MKTLDELQDYLAEQVVEGTAYFTDPSYVPAIIGISQDERLVYDYDKMIEFLMETDGMSHEDAVEFIDYNTVKATPFMGDKAPIILYRSGMIE